MYSGRAILTALYVCIIVFCCTTPLFFYFRMRWDNRNDRRLREMEIRVTNESMRNHNEESRAARRKYRAERRARIRQLFAPFRWLLTEDTFVHSEKSGEKSMTIETCMVDSLESQEPTQEEQIPMEGPAGESNGKATDGEPIDNTYDSDDFILVPKPGVPHSDKPSPGKLRKVPNECSICLCEYNVGSDIVWSSNPKCEHVFHTSCIEQWLLKQREGPLCPCCRRDFVIDPFDSSPDETDDLEKGAPSRNSNHQETTPSTNVDTVVQINSTTMVEESEDSRMEMDEVCPSRIEMVEV